MEDNNTYFVKEDDTFLLWSRPKTINRLSTKYIHTSTHGFNLPACSCYFVLIFPKLFPFENIRPLYPHSPTPCVPTKRMPPSHELKKKWNLIHIRENKSGYMMIWIFTSHLLVW